IESRRQAALAAVHGQTHALRRRSLRTQAQLQSFFDQAGEARLLLRGERLGLGKQRVVQVERGFHGRPQQASRTDFCILQALEPRRTPTPRPSTLLPSTRYIRPINTRIKTITRITPSPPLGP